MGTVTDSMRQSRTYVEEEETMVELQEEEAETDTDWLEGERFLMDPWNVLVYNEREAAIENGGRGGGVVFNFDTSRGNEMEVKCREEVME